MPTFCLKKIDLLKLYECSKRTKTDYPAFGYDIDKGHFIKVTETVFKKIESGKVNVILFVNSYQVCLKIIDEYLAQPCMEDYKDGANKVMREKEYDKIVAFLWFFEDIDGTYSFDDFELKKVDKIVTKWAIENGFELLDETYE